MFVGIQKMDSITPQTSGSTLIHCLQRNVSNGLQCCFSLMAGLVMGGPGDGGRVTEGGTTERTASLLQYSLVMDSLLISCV